MKFLIAILFCCSLLPRSEEYPREILPKDTGLSPGRAAAFFRLLLSGRGSEPADYASEEDYRDEDSPFSNFYFNENDLNEEETMPDSYYKLGSDPMGPFPPDDEEIAQKRATTIKPTPVPTTTEEIKMTLPSIPSSDGLASIPPVYPGKGQKEYAMLRPPNENNHRIGTLMKIICDQKLAEEKNEKDRLEHKPVS